jgi:hypothetical protein
MTQSVEGNAAVDFMSFTARLEAAPFQNGFTNFGWCKCRGLIGPRFLFVARKGETKMKSRKILGCRIKGNKERGAWAELYFMVLAMSYGLKVPSPYGGLGPYDVGVENGGPILRVQVKCTIFPHPKGGYGIDLKGPGRRGYLPGTVDFFALYVIPTDDWYIVPYAVVGQRYANLHFTPGAKRRPKYGKYLEAWHLLLDAAKGRTDGPISIQACCDETDPAEGVRKLIQPSAVRKMFRGVFQG